jgi:hypothetical protein
MRAGCSEAEGTPSSAACMAAACIGEWIGLPTSEGPQRLTASAVPMAPHSRAPPYAHAPVHAARPCTPRQPRPQHARPERNCRRRAARVARGPRPGGGRGYDRGAPAQRQVSGADALDWGGGLERGRVGAVAAESAGAGARGGGGGHVRANGGDGAQVCGHVCISGWGVGAWGGSSRARAPVHAGAWAGALRCKDRAGK